MVLKSPGKCIGIQVENMQRKKDGEKMRKWLRIDHANEMPSLSPPEISLFVPNNFSPLFPAKTSRGLQREEEEMMRGSVG